MNLISFNVFLPSMNLDDPQVETKILYNSGFKTGIGSQISSFKLFSNGISSIYGKGDGLVGSDGIDYVCKRWSKTQCQDVNSSDSEFNHRNLIKSPHSLSMIAKILKLKFQIPNDSL